MSESNATQTAREALKQEIIALTDQHRMKGGTAAALRMEITAALQELTPEELKLLAQLIQGMKERGGCEDE